MLQSKFKKPRVDGGEDSDGEGAPSVAANRNSSEQGSFGSAGERVPGSSASINQTEDQQLSGQKRLASAISDNNTSTELRREPASSGATDSSEGIFAKRMLDINSSVSKSSKREVNWDSQYEALVAFANKNGHCNLRVNQGNETGENLGANLYAWLALQRRQKKLNKLRKDREAKLQALVAQGKMSWSVGDSSRVDDEEGQQQPPPPPSWESYFDALLAYTEDHGHANVPKGHMALVEKRRQMDLGAWVKEQRLHLSTGNLSEAHRSKLNILVNAGLFSWTTPLTEMPAMPQNVLDANWDLQLEAVTHYAVTRGNCNVDTPGVTIMTSYGVSFDLGLWVRCQRRRYELRTLAESRLTRLQGLVERGLLQWMSPEVAAQRAAEKEKKRKEEDVLWFAWYNVLVWFGKNKGHCNLGPGDTVSLPDESEAELGKWLDIQKKILARNKMKPDRALKLRKLVDEGKLPLSWRAEYAQIEQAGAPVAVAAVAVVQAAPEPPRSAPAVLAEQHTV
jgi:hypothetical protein